MDRIRKYKKFIECLMDLKKVTSLLSSNSYFYVYLIQSGFDLTPQDVLAQD